MSRWTLDSNMHDNRIKIERCSNGWSLSLRRVERCDNADGGTRTVKEHSVDEDLEKQLRRAQRFFED